MYTSEGMLSFFEDLSNSAAPDFGELLLKSAERDEVNTKQHKKQEGSKGPDQSEAIDHLNRCGAKFENILMRV
jgi:hypothetical protein